MSWKSIQLDSIGEIKGGKRLPSGHAFSESPTQHLYIRARDIGQGKIGTNDPVYLDERTAAILRRYTVRENDIVITIVGANIGDVGFVTEELSGANLTENAAKVTALPEICDPKFLQCQLATDAAKRRFQGIAAGSISAAVTLPVRRTGFVKER